MMDFGSYCLNAGSIKMSADRTFEDHAMTYKLFTSYLKELSIVMGNAMNDENLEDSEKDLFRYYCTSWANQIQEKWEDLYEEGSI